MTKMYRERKRNIAAFRGCAHNCVYCAFRGALFRQRCELCKTFEPHEHFECFNQKPQRTGKGEFVTIGLCGDVAFASREWWEECIGYCETYNSITFLLQSKDPSCFLRLRFPENVILGTTLETNRDYDVSEAPCPVIRASALAAHPHRHKWVTIEPIMDFDVNDFHKIILDIQPKRVYAGYNSLPHIKLPEPSLEKTESLITMLKTHTEVILKLMRPPISSL